MVTLTRWGDAAPGAAAVAPWPARLCGRAMRCSAACRGAAVWLRLAGGEVHGAATHPDLALLAAVQEETGEGPCAEATRSLRTVVAADLVAEPRWPVFRVAALERGLRSCAAVPVAAEGAAVTVTLYAFRPWRLAAAEAEVVRGLAAEAVAGLVGDGARAAAEAEAAQLRAAMVSRAVIDQALGIVMHLLDCDATDAFGVLRVLSQRTNRKLNTVAARLVRERGRGATRELRRLLGEVRDGR
ncbi:GAF and ANTAR domain-containing protein [Streptomyces sp. NPDC088864]|uniref:GAF and ANTAR domain-containing protein n=1 Tax=Streptomyces sp. NPDC088864 TaxID=3365910 RepID=UPI00382D8EC2